MFLSLDQIEQAMCANKKLLLNVDLQQLNYVQKRTQVRFEIFIYKMCLQIMYVVNIYIYIDRTDIE